MGNQDRVAVIIPFRDRGRDPLRQANLDATTKYWAAYGLPATVVDDGRTGDAQFNRSAAYNRGIAAFPDATVFVFTESDMIIDVTQINRATMKAMAQPGLVVPFSEYRYLSDSIQGRSAPATYNPPMRPPRPS